jgi:hypothetical protein
MNNYKQFNWIAAWLLTAVTCGLYAFYMWGYMGAANNAEAERLGCKKIMGFVPALLLSFVTCGIFLIVWYYWFAAQQIEIAQKKGLKTEPTDSAIVYFILMFVPIYSYYVLCENFNRVINA